MGVITGGLPVVSVLLNDDLDLDPEFFSFIFSQIFYICYGVTAQKIMYNNAKEKKIRGKCGSVTKCKLILKRRGEKTRWLN